MAEEKKKYMRGVVIEFDFTAIDGAQILFDLAKKRLAEDGIDLDIKLEAKHLVGGNYQGGISELFAALEKQGDPARTARDLAEAFKAAVTEHIPAGVTHGFKEFVKAVIAKDIKVIVSTRGDVSVLQAALEGLPPEMVVAYQETSNTYGNCKWDAWRRVCAPNGIHELITVAVAGSGAGVKSALVAGMSVIGVVHPHTAYQDFGGADVVVEKIDASLAPEVFRMQHLG